MNLNKLLKFLSFGCVCLIIPVMAVATVLEKIYGSEFARNHIYTSLTVIVIWGVLSFFSIWYMLQVKLYKKIATFSLHLSLVVILIGALITHLSGKQGKIHLRIGEIPVNEYVLSEDSKEKMPFSLELKDFTPEFYPGTFSPFDFISVIKIYDNKGERELTISMNNIGSYGNYRFYQSGYDADGRGSSISVSFDPYGIAVTYTGYVWLLLSIILFFFQKKTLFKSILASPQLKKGITVIALLAFTIGVKGAPQYLPKEIAEEFGDLYVYYNGRVAPLNTLSLDFTKKLYGKAKYQGLTPEQVLTGWFFFYDDWKNEPVIKIKGENVKRTLGIQGDYSKLTDFIGPSGFKLEESLREHGGDYKDVAEANEKFNLVSSLVTGSILQIYPFHQEDSPGLKWFSVNDRPVEDMPYEQWLFIRSSLSLVAEKVAMQDWTGVSELVGKIKKYQEKEGYGLLPSPHKIKAEKFYNKWNLDKPLSMIFLTFGIILFAVFILTMSSGKIIGNRLILACLSIMFLLFLYLSMQLGLRWYISQHIPLSNGFETMLFMSWCSALLTITLSRYQKLILPFGFILCGFTLLVAMIGESSPQITNLMPVLQSPLLSIHVMVIMTAYTLLAFTMLDGMAAVAFSFGKNSAEKILYLQDVSRLLLYPAVFLLAIGIFIGAVWANVSWGRYWGWDPKEVWALITLLIYAMPLHSVSLPWFRNPLFFHVYSIFAFLSVIITYFGVNFFLGGMHSYA